MENQQPKPTIVLVHGAFADASGWSAVAERLRAADYPVLAPANPLRSLSGDADYIASVLTSIAGPIILVGHSYGGAVITNAARGIANVKALVYISAFAPDEGEDIFALTGKFPGSLLPVNTLTRPYPNGSTEPGVDVYLSLEHFHEVFAADVPAGITELMAVEQRPLALAAGNEASGASPAWSTIPSWYLAGRDDMAIPFAAQQFMAKRAQSHLTEVAASHVPMISQPAEVTGVIVDAARATA
ncbi:alpha/beta fold hydrolase [Kribbella sp. NPDC058693]|uniref:alpha/beta fold hydrolase n=1 Tax=Kribbella sp. NPDC058693 TaxID=3346602 RepID=UPI0036540F2E